MMFPLNEQQRRHLAVVLDQVDGALLEVIASASGGARGDAAPRFLRPQQRDIPAAVALRLLAAAQSLRTRLGNDLGRLGMPRNSESLRRRAAAYLTSALVLLEDCHAAAMAAYGDVDPRLPTVLDPWLVDLEAEVNALRVLVGTETGDGASR
jgi:hypothetical protein